MKKIFIGLFIGVLVGAIVVLVGQSLILANGTASASVATGPKKIKVPFMHMRNFGADAGHDGKPSEDRIGAGSEIEMWNIDDTRPLTITEIYFTSWDGKTTLEGSKLGLPLPLELKPHTHYHFNSFYEDFKLPVPTIPKEKASYIHGYLADIRWQGPAPRVRGWDLGVKNGQYILSMPIAVFEE